MKVGDLVSYAARDNQFVGMIIATKRYGTTLVRHPSHLSTFPYLSIPPLP